VTTRKGNSGRWGGPWNCPYCDYKSTRKFNMCLHIDRRHRTRYNPFHDFRPINENPNLQKRVTFYDSMRYSEGNQPSLNSYPNSNYSVERYLWIRNLSQQIIWSLLLCCLLFWRRWWNRPNHVYLFRTCHGNLY
jgi:hypothetical protein